MIDQDLWTQLEGERPAGPTGRVRRRVATLGSNRGAFAAIEHPIGLRMLLIELEQAPELEPTAAAGIYAELDAAPAPTLKITLSDPQFADLFTALCLDLVAVAEAAPERTGEAVRDRVLRWMQFLERTRGDALGPMAQRGLWGELTVLRETVAPTLGILQTVQAWRGPARAAQDFQAGGLAIEVKTTIAGKDQRVRVTSERQLDDSNLQTLILMVLAIDMRPQAGETLNAAVDSARAMTDTDARARPLLEEGLLAVGYNDIHRDEYADFGYALRDCSAYHVRAGFPRITERDLPDGIGQVGYQLSASACSPFLLEMGERDALIAAAAP